MNSNSSSPITTAVVAGWGARLQVFANLDDAITAHDDIFLGGGYDPAFFASIGVAVETFKDDDGELSVAVTEPVSLLQALAIAAYVNSEGNFDEFVLRPAWPFEAASGQVWQAGENDLTPYEIAQRQAAQDGPAPDEDDEPDPGVSSVSQVARECPPACIYHGQPASELPACHCPDGEPDLDRCGSCGELVDLRTHDCRNETPAQDGGR